MNFTNICIALSNWATDFKFLFVPIFTLDEVANEARNKICISNCSNSQNWFLLIRVPTLQMPKLITLDL